MKILHVHRSASFKALETALQLTPGALDSHLKVLVQRGWVLSRLHPGQRGSPTVFEPTPVGDRAFSAHVRSLKEFLLDLRTDDD